MNAIEDWLRRYEHYQLSSIAKTELREIYWSTINKPKKSPNTLNKSKE